MVFCAFAAWTVRMPVDTATHTPRLTIDRRGKEGIALTSKRFSALRLLIEEERGVVRYPKWSALQLGNYVSIDMHGCGNVAFLGSAVTSPR
jgi:hypothetical protein